MQSLSTWAKTNKVTYNQAYRSFERGQITGAKQLPTGAIIIEDIQDNSKVSVTSNFGQKGLGFEPLVTDFTVDNLKISKASTKTRTNRVAHIDIKHRYDNIENTFVPFRYSQSTSNNSNLTIRDVITLCQKAYYGFAIVKNIVDTMSEFSASSIYLTGGNKKSRDFFTAYFKKINLQDFIEKFFIEFYRSGNVFIYPMRGKIKESDLTKLTQVFGLQLSKAANVTLPIRYIILNPADVEIQGSVSFSNPVYIKILSDYELARLKNPKTDEDKEVLEGLDSESKKTIKDKKTGIVGINLDSKNIYAVFNKKMDYEAFAVSMIFPVLDDLEFKTELKRMDRAIARTCQQAVLLLTFGLETKDGQYQYNQNTATAFQKIFENESVGRVLIADFTTKASFVIPEIGDLLDPKKYTVVNQDIKEGLNNILFSDTGEKFANQNAKVKIFVEKLRAARESFLNNFLSNEIKKIAQELGFKNYPIAQFEDIDLEDDTEFKRIMARLAEIGFLTPDETFEAMQTKRLPSKEESLEAQEEYKNFKDKGLYEPLVGGQFTQQKMQDNQLNVQKELADKAQQNQLKIAEMRPKTLSQPTGRPSGTTRKQSTKKISPIGKGSIKEGYSLTKIKDNLLLAAKLEEEIVNKLKKKHKIKGELEDKQKEIAEQLRDIIIANEENKDWLNKINDYIEKPIDTNNTRVEEQENIAYVHQLDSFIAGILLNSKI